MNKQDMYEHIKNKVYDKLPNNGGREFYADLLETFSLDAKDPVVPRMYSLAWQNGHAYGYGEVLSHFEDLVEVFKGV